MPTLSADNLGKRYGRRILFRRLSFTLEGGTSLAITGANGSGKSTLVRMLAGLLRPTRGEVTLTVNGTPVPDERRALQCGLVAPYLNVYDGFTARENLAFIASARSMTRAESRIEEVLEYVGLANRADDLVSTYSSGMTQRVRLAAALLPAPPLLLLDEPTATLDEAGRQVVRGILTEQQAAGTLLVVATNVAEEAALCDRQLRIEDHR